MAEEKNEQKEAEAKEEESKAEASKEEAKTSESVEEESASAPEGESTEVPEKFQDLVAKIEEMSVLELSELVKVLEGKFGVSSAAPVAAAAPSAGGGDEGEEEEKASYDIELTETGDNKLGLIKVLREVTDLGLKDAKEKAESVPQVIKEGAPKEQAEEIKSKLEEAGATVTLK